MPVKEVEQRRIAFYKRHLELLYDTYSPKVYGFLLQQTNSKEEADELLIIVFMKVWAQVTTISMEDEKKISLITLSTYKKRYNTHPRAKLFREPVELVKPAVVDE